jgi:NAD(P)-dependent dehydrogenase (short-subunit alcohol dehydrogenase family)
MSDQGNGDSGELRFDGRVALVTGGGTGIGRAFALALASRGARVLVNGLPGEKVNSQAQVADEIRAAGGEAIPVDGRVGVDEDARRMVQTAIDTYGRIDIIVNNAGTSGTPTAIQDDPDDGFQSEINVHLYGPMQINRAAWPHMVGQKYGRIVYAGSASGLGWQVGRSGDYEGSYPCAKATIFAAAKQTAGAGQDHGIKANIYLPWAWTPQVERTLGHTEFSLWMKENFRPEIVAAGALYLLHEDCPVSGEAISIAGGRVTRIINASPEGYFNRDLTPEAVRDNWAQVYGDVDGTGRITGMKEIKGQAGEYVLIEEMFRQKF